MQNNSHRIVAESIEQVSQSWLCGWQHQVSNKENLKQNIDFWTSLLGGIVKKGGENIQKCDDKQNYWECHMMFRNFVKLKNAKKEIILSYHGSYLWPWMLLTFRNIVNKVLLLTLNFCSCCCCTFTVFVLPRLWTF